MAYNIENSSRKKGKKQYMIFEYILLFLSIYSLVKIIIEEFLTKVILNRISYKSQQNEFIKYINYIKNN